MYLSKIKPRWVVVFVLLNLHAVGVWGMYDVTYREQFEAISWLNLLVSFFAVAAFHTPRNLHAVYYLAASFAVGMLAEIAGVATGYLFGSYYYTNKLGAMAGAVPLVIGTNWALLGYCSGMLVAGIQSVWQRMLAAASVMVGIDVLLEPFAIEHGFWVWQSHTPPLQNYIAWWLVALLVQFFYVRFIPRSSNKVALPYLFILTLFLLGCRIRAAYS